jgi:hypothetical protein
VINQNQGIFKNFKLRYHHLIWILNDEMYVYSGMCEIERPNLDVGDDISYNYDDFWAFNLITNKWRRIHFSLGNLPSPRSELNSVLYKNQIFFFGGYGNVNSLHKNNLFMKTSYLNDGFCFGKYYSDNKLNEIFSLENNNDNIKNFRKFYYENNEDIPYFRAGSSFVILKFIYLGCFE